MATLAFQSILPKLTPFRMPRPLEHIWASLLGIDEIARVYSALRTMSDGRSIADRLLDFLSISYATSDIDLGRIPRRGAAIVTVNHPFGMLDGAILASLLGQLRPDVRFLANEILTVIPELHEILIPIDAMSGDKAANSRGLRRAIEHLRGGGMLVIFPAGEVSHYQWKDRDVTDSEWSPIAARLANISLAPIVPACVQGENGWCFQAAGVLHPALRTALLVRELLNKRGRRIEVRFGAPIPPDKLKAIPTARERADYLRWRTYLLDSRERFKPKTALPLARGGESALDVQPIAAPTAPGKIAAEVEALADDCLLCQSGDLRMNLTRAVRIPNVLRELGRLREITFRAAGEGTGRPIDLDEFDVHYLHLFVWNAAKQELVGAYRLAQTDLILRQHGVRGLYTATLFRYSKPFLDRLGPALELGRSFVRQEYQKGFAPLLLLWNGIGAFLARNPQYRILYGAVSISNRYEAVSRELIVSFLEKYETLRDWAGLVRNRRAFRERRLKGAKRPAFPETGFDVEDLSAVVSDIEQKQAGVPVLLRQYLKLGGKLLGFHVDPKFASALDGLILVDLTKTNPNLLRRYLGKNESAKFLAFQKGQKHETQ